MLAKIGIYTHMYKYLGAFAIVFTQKAYNSPIFMVINAKNVSKNLETFSY